MTSSRRVPVKIKGQSAMMMLGISEPSSSAADRTPPNRIQLVRAQDALAFFFLAPSNTATRVFLWGEHCPGHHGRYGHDPVGLVAGASKRTSDALNISGRHLVDPKAANLGHDVALHEAAVFDRCLGYFLGRMLRQKLGHQIGDELRSSLLGSGCRGGLSHRYVAQQLLCIFSSRGRGPRAAVLANNITLDATAMAALNDVDAASTWCDLQAEASKAGVPDEAIVRARPLSIDGAYLALKSKLS